MSFVNLMSPGVSAHHAEVMQRKMAIDGLTESDSLLKKGIWIYFLLVLFEGALRKWVLPGLSTPLLLVRDPIALFLVIKMINRKMLPSNGYITGMALLGIVGTVCTLLFGHGNLGVALYGARIFLIHFPMIFIMGKVLDREDVLRIGRFIVWLSLPMTVLIALQFYSPQDAWVNRGVGGNMEGAGFSGALGFFRPPGTFSFTNGNTLFYSFLAPFIFYFWLNPKLINRLILIAATICLFASISFSISRSLFFQVIITLIFATLAIARKPQYLGKMIIAYIAGSLLFIALSQTSVVQTSIEAFTSRFEGAVEHEGGLQGTLGNRYIGGMLEAVAGSPGSPFFGYGLGYGTSVGGTLLQGKEGLQISEDEWARMIGEMGPLMGLIAVFLRVGLSLNMAMRSYKKLAIGDLLPWMLLSFGLINVMQGQWAQPTSLGFGIVIGGLLMASLNDEKQRDQTAPGRKLHVHGPA
ncbi:MAG: hypothetical protein ABIX01_21325 [Chitinophagaceae bacterium]